MNKVINKRISLLLLLSLVFVFLTGCWDQLEIEDRALVLGLSIDSVPANSKTEDDQTTHLKSANINLPKIRVTAQIAVPGRVPLGPSSGGEGSGGNQNPVWVVQVYGYSLDDALNNLQQQISDPRYLIHLRVIIISEDFARKNLSDLNDYLRRNPEVRRRTWLLVSEGEASKFMNINPPLQRVPTLYILSTMEKAVRSGKFPANYIGVFWSAESKWGESGYLPYVSLHQKDNMLIKGLAYFSGGVMVGSTTPIEIGAYMSMKGLDPGGYSVMFNSEDFGPLTLKVNDRFTRSKVKIKDGKPHITINIYLEAALDEHLGNNIRIDSSQDLKKLEANFQKGVLTIFDHLIKQTQQAHSDIFGMGEYVRAYAPSYWKANVRDKHDWEQQYSDLSIELNVKTNIERVGLKED
ncbi:MULTISPECIES: Ger(x)C family spore germination protein [Paenibacillus]|uniref:Spore gernimation protein GerC n=1 Tax=Paenibacillus odorifer TaxID=189426 RepID=A0A1R0WV71_9BACL|nr:Ger(x)C family spore germination protein [Paenibacillus odorifer]AIQ72886.1 spore gernimation protein GerC [Paenibacillus odorifer]MEC0132546.1 Ger(x)C family spore germination protein [Paenibacillus odorifer]MEC0225207.1 Ger(x)C family spore germination protein [Paenibacillus odorifer]OMC99566.1 spore gernimation protein GerC [Paenibacillus odorifer]OMD15625.1 spore gernimation protein GerC [Paenibacillus odorifer]